LGLCLRDPVEGLERLLCELAELTQLTLDQVIFDSSFFRQLAVANPQFLPHLHSLELLRLDESFVCSDLHKFVYSRTREGRLGNGTGLNKVRVERSSEWWKHPTSRSMR
jgi:hypothetical protein